MTCPHGFEKVGQCVECMYDEPVPAAPKPKAHVEYVTTSRYEGQCPECDLPVLVGQRIARLSTGPWVHEHCAPA